MLENTVAAHYCGLQLPPAWVNNLAQKKWRQSRTQRGCAHGDGGVRMVASFPRYCASSWFSLVSQNCQHWLGTAPLCYLGEDATCLQVLVDITSVDGLRHPSCFLPQTLLLATQDYTVACPYKDCRRLYKAHAFAVAVAVAVADVVDVAVVVAVAVAVADAIAVAVAVADAIAVAVAVAVAEVAHDAHDGHDWETSIIHSPSIAPPL